MPVRSLLALPLTAFLLVSPVLASDSSRDARLSDLRSRVAQANVALSGQEACGANEACQRVLRSFGLDPAYYEMAETEIGDACEQDDDQTACDWLDAIFLPETEAAARFQHQEACRLTPDHDDCAAFRRN